MHHHIFQTERWNTFAKISLGTGSSNNAQKLSLTTLHAWSQSSRFFSSGYLKERIFANNPQNLDALKTNIWRGVRNILADMIAGVIVNFNVGIATVIQQRGGWIENMISYWNLTALKVYNFGRICKDKMVILMEQFGEKKLEISSLHQNGDDK